MRCLLAVPLLFICIGCRGQGQIKSAADLGFLKSATKVEDSPSDPHLGATMDKLFHKSYEFPFPEKELDQRVGDEVLKVSGWSKKAVGSYSGPDGAIIGLFAGRRTGMIEKFGIPVPVWSDKDQYSTAWVIFAQKQ